MPAMKQQHRVNISNNYKFLCKCVGVFLNRIVSKFHGAQLETFANITAEAGEHTRLMRLSISNPLN